MKLWMKRSLGVAAAVLAAATLVYSFCPKPALLESIPFSTAVYDRHGTLLRLTLASDDRYRLFVPIERIAPSLIESTLLYEDAHYYDHPGINPAALLRAAWQTYVVRRRAVGASTISMQVARMLFHIDSRTIPGKLIQIVRALQLERHYSKAQILEAYLNLAPYGHNIEGVGAASLTYFGKQAAVLSLPEAMALSVIPQNPSARVPTRAEGYATMIQARSRLFARWRETHPHQGAEQAALMAMPLAIHAIGNLPFLAPHFVEARLQHADRRGGEMHTTLDLPLQRLLEQRIAAYVARKKTLGIANASAMLLDYRSMQVVASVGSADFFDDAIEGQVDGTMARRSPGSALKPLIYALAMDEGLIHPMSMLKDAPRRFGAYTPENFDRGLAGPIFARDALIYSRNVPAVSLMARLEKPGFYTFLQRAGISDLKSEAFYGLALALGGVEVRMDELVRLYAMLANAGRLQPLRTMLDDTGHPPGNTVSQGKALLSPEAAFLTLDMLRRNPRPEVSARLGNVGTPLPVAWKTGTSFAFRDAWSVGVFGPYVLAVWVGNFDGEGNPSFVGRRAAAPLFFDLVDAVAQSQGGLKSAWTDPKGLKLTRVKVCAPTGDLPNRDCPATVSSWFIPGKSPIRVSDIYRAVPVRKQSGLRACSAFDDGVEMRVYEFWPSDMLALFRKAGISRRQPPPYEPGCTMDVKAATGLAPQIRSPGRHIVYAVRSEKLGEERIPFMAVADADVKRLYWFVDDHFVGSVRNGEALTWHLRPQTAEVRVVDDHGRADWRRITVQMVQ
jgi:penicillin-binding protein 1C